MRSIRSRITYANAAATLALFLALGLGTAYAVNVDSGDVENNSLKSKDLKDGKGVKCEDFAAGEPACQSGGGGGGDASAGLTNLTVRTANNPSVASGGSIDVDCQAGERATGGSVEQTYAVDRPKPAAAGSVPTGWQATNLNPGTSPVTVYVVCAS